MTRPKKNPLLHALISELPDAGSDWPVEKQLAWLNLMAMAFGMVYGGDAAQQMGASTEKKTVEPAKFGAVKKTEKPKPTYAFMIDEGGYVMRGNGERVSPKEVNGKTVHDMRGIDGDLGAIIWADGTMGLNGADINISAA